jgi:hypothetical protein
MLGERKIFIRTFLKTGTTNAKQKANETNTTTIQQHKGETQ